MRLLQTSYDDRFPEIIKDWMSSISGNNTASLFHVYIPYDEEDLRNSLEEVRKILKENAPGIPVIGCSATGEILDGAMLDDELVVTLLIFEDPTTRIEVLPYYERPDDIDSQWLFEHLQAIPDLKGIEVLTAATYETLEAIGKVIDNLPEEIDVFGGVAVGDVNFPSFVFANDGKQSFDGSAVVFYSGPELHIQTDRMFGWKPIGYPFKVTKVQGPVVYELDEKPAYEVYNHYLHIKNDKNFFYNALEFPWEVRIDEETAYIRHAKSVNPDGSILMSSNIPEGSEVKITFGDPRRIIKHTKQVGDKIREFGPQVVNIVNCMGRKLFWAGNEKVEIKEISKHLMTTGFSALGEVMRYKGNTLLNNLSIVTVAMREGPIPEKIELNIDEIENKSNISITARLAIFINTMTEELMEKNDQLNEMLYKASHDALTKLYNRGAIERIIYEGAEECDLIDKNWHLIMFDIDDFKQINDQHGHSEGDNILKTIARTLDEYIKTLDAVEIGRWGGEEFMVYARGYDDEKVKEIADTILLKIRNEAFHVCKVTASVGVTRHRKDEDVLGTINRVDELLYEAKANGKDQFCTDL